MLEVEFYALEGEDPESVLQGRVRYYGGRLYGRPAKKEDADWFETLMSESIRYAGPDGWSVADPQTEPEKWISNLHRQYRSYVLWATEAVEKPDPVPVRGRGRGKVALKG